MGAYPKCEHQPREEQTLFDRLRRRSPESASILDRLQAEHRAGSQLLIGMRASLEAFESGAAGVRERFMQHLQGFTDAKWRHMTHEGRLHPPLASRCLPPQNWTAVAGAVATHMDPLFNVEPERPSLACLRG